MEAMRKSDDSKLGEWTTSNMEYGNFYKLKLNLQREKEDRVELKDVHAECKRELEALRKELEQCRAQLRDYNSLMRSPPSSTSTCCTSCSSSCTVQQRPMVSKLDTNCNVEEEINGSGSHDNAGKQASTFSKTRMQLAGGRLHAATRCASSSHTNLKSREQENHPAKSTKGGVRIQRFRVGGAGPKLGRESISHKRKLKEISSSCPLAPTVADTTLAKK